ncbi:hypothetical protein L2E82_07338 [Cichorium intybus]|uniref:Uncharacterized protein n=1 Tax=Cichorium intybus TaxID=13427 RepID=A0ACB9G550_CICIN|nr:hypothetical protein L2E82_07338 [Cichorium intybus]
MVARKSRIKSEKRGRIDTQTSIKILVAVKHIVDYAVKIRIKSDKVNTTSLLGVSPTRTVTDGLVWFAITIRATSNRSIPQHLGNLTMLRVLNLRYGLWQSVFPVKNLH